MSLMIYTYLYLPIENYFKIIKFDADLVVEHMASYTINMYRPTHIKAVIGLIISYRKCVTPRLNKFGYGIFGVSVQSWSCRTNNLKL